MGKVLCWGIGGACETFINMCIQINKEFTKSIIAFIDSNKKNTTYYNRDVIEPNQINDFDFDGIIVTTVKYNNEIFSTALKLNINPENLIFIYNLPLLGMNKNPARVENILGKDIARRILSGTGYAFRLFTKYNETRNSFIANIDNYYELLQKDFVRYQTYDLCVKEIKKRNLNGNIAEFGVFRGEFAQFLNISFPDKKLYLFDTFEGFDSKEALQEINNGYLTNTMVSQMENTSINEVLNRMKWKKNVVIKKGFFPKSLGGLEDNFSFVSIDVDLETSTYEGIKYFYPRLEKGGYIFIHDYNYFLLQGVENAIDQYEKEIGYPLCKVPIADEYGSIIITK